MPIRIIKGDPVQPGLLERRPLQTIVVRQAETVKGPGESAKVDDTRPSGDPAVSQTTWAMVEGLCTVTQRPFQLAFRREGGTYVLRSADRSVSPGAARDIGDIIGAFDWAVFACPGCGKSWRHAKEEGPAPPVVYCSCRSLFCTGKGLRKRMTNGVEEWWWTCPKCGIDERIRIGINSLRGQAMKGK